MRQSLWTRFSCGRHFHRPKLLGLEAIDVKPGGERTDVMDGMVSRSIPPPLSDVLGRAFGLPHLAFRRALGTNRQPHRAEPAWSAIREHQHELLLSERSLVVFFHAHPVLSNLSATFLGSEKTRAMDLFANRVCHRISRALSDAGCLSAERYVDTGRLCHLSTPRICFWSGSRDVVRAVAATSGTLSPWRRRISDRIAALSSSPPALLQWLHLHLRRLRHRRLLLPCDNRPGRNYFAVPATGESDRPGGSVLLRQLPGPPALRDQVGASHSRATDLGVFAHCCRNAVRAQCMGNPFGKRNHLICQQTRPEQEKAFQLRSPL